MSDSKGIDGSQAWMVSSSVSGDPGRDSKVIDLGIVSFLLFQPVA